MLSLLEMAPKKRAPQNLRVASLKKKKEKRAKQGTTTKIRKIQKFSQNSQDVNDIFRVEVQ